MEKRTFSREFIMLDREDKREGMSQEKMTGFIRVDLSGEKGEIFCNLQGVKRDDGVGYKLYIVPGEDVQGKPICAGDIHIVDSKGQLNYKFDARDVNMSGHSIEDFDCFLVVAEGVKAKEDYKKQDYLLVGFRDEPFDWRAKFRTDAAEQSDESKLCTACEQENVQQCADEFKEDENELSLRTDGDGYSTNNEEDIEKDDKELVAQTVNNHVENDHQLNVKQDCGNNTGQAKSRLMPESDCSACVFYKEQSNDPNMPCFIYNQNEQPVDIEFFAETFGKYFVSCMPFEWTGRNYKWWRVTDVTCLSNVLCRGKIKALFLYNPAVTAAFCKYEYIIVGIYNTRKNNQYIVCGIPSTYGVDKHSLHELGRWFPVRYKRPMMWDFGYWVIYIEPSTGRIVV